MPTQLLRLGRLQWLFLAPALLIVLPCILVIEFQPDVDLWLVRRFELPALQAAYGFSAAYVSLHSAEGFPCEVFTITGIAPNSPFARAGVHPGDIPTFYKHGQERGFLYDLIWARRGHSVSLALISTEDFTPALQRTRFARR